MTKASELSAISAQLFPIFKNYDIKSAVLFGSYAKGKATEKSDIDLLVDSGLRGLRFVEFMEDVRIATGKEVDVFDVAHIQPNSQIANEIRASGVSLYEK